MKQSIVLSLAVILGVVAPPACAQTAAPATVDATAVLAHLHTLADPALEGRATGSSGNAAAREYIVDALKAAGVEPAIPGWIQEFQAGPREGRNVLGVVRGSRDPERYIVLSAHYDHLGVRGGRVYPGADDNASGTAALLEIARLVAATPLEHSVVFAAFDAEEIGLVGARAFVREPPMDREAILLDINLDMVSRNDANEIFLAGPFHYPQVGVVADQLSAHPPVQLRRGHDDPSGRTGEDWTDQSDHGAFHSAGIPFAYFGVEDHPDYHQPTDSYERIDPEFYVAVVGLVYDYLQLADEAVDRW